MALFVALVILGRIIIELLFGRDYSKETRDFLNS